MQVYFSIWCLANLCQQTSHLYFLSACHRITNTIHTGRNTRNQNKARQILFPATKLTCHQHIGHFFFFIISCFNYKAFDWHKKTLCVILYCSWYNIALCKTLCQIWFFRSIGMQCFIAILYALCNQLITLAQKTQNI